MKRAHIMAALTLAFILGIGISVVSLSSDPSASAAEDVVDVLPVISEGTELPQPSEALSVATVQTAAEFAAAAANEEVTDIILSNDIGINVEIDRNNPLTINLNGHQLFYSNTLGSNTTSVIKLSRGILTITGDDSTDISHNTIRGVKSAIAVSGAAHPVDGYYSSLNIDERVHIYSQDEYAIAVVPHNTGAQQYDSHGVLVNMNGSADGAYGIYVNGLIKHFTGRPQIYIGNGARLTNNQIKEDGTPIYAAGNAEWHIGRAYLAGKAGLGIKAGKFTFIGTNISINGTESAPDLSNSGIIGTSAVFQLEHNAGYSDDIVININDGIYSSANSNVFYEYGNTGNAAQININDGLFQAGTNKAVLGGDTAGLSLVINGGTFSGNDLARIAGYLAEGLALSENGQVYRPVAGDVTLSNSDDSITVTGTFGTKDLFLETERNSGIKLDVFGDRQPELYIIHVLDGNTWLTNLPTSMRVSIKVPSRFDGKQIQVYALSERNTVATKVDFTYQDGAVEFVTNTLGTFAIVEEDSGPGIDPENPGSSTGGSSATKFMNLTYGGVSVEGNFARGANLKMKELVYNIEAFKDYRYKLYDLTIEKSGNKVQPVGAAKVSIKLPSGFDGNKTSVYYISDNGEIKRYDSEYKDGKIVFSTTHFSIYALVEDGGRGAAGVPEGSKAPSTGVIRSAGAGNAVVSKVLPVIVAASLAGGVYWYMLMMHRRNAKSSASVDYEITTIIPEVKAQKQMVIVECEKFVATPMTDADREQMCKNIYNN